MEKPDHALSLRESLHGPDRYQAYSPWGPLTATMVVVTAVLSQIVLLLVILGLVDNLAPEGFDFWSFEREITTVETPLGVIFTLAAQVTAGLIIWLAAGYKGARTMVLRLAAPKPSWTACVAMGILMALAIAPFELMAYYLTGTELITDARWLADGLRHEAWIITLVVAIVLAPIWEELAFRGFLLSALAKTRLGFWPAAILITVAWALLHAGYSIPGLISVTLAGLALSWIMRRTGSMRAVVVAHAVSNAIACAVAYVLTMSM